MWHDNNTGLFCLPPVHLVKTVADKSEQIVFPCNFSDSFSLLKEKHNHFCRNAVSIFSHIFGSSCLSEMVITENQKQQTKLGESNASENHNLIIFV